MTSSPGVLPADPCPGALLPPALGPGDQPQRVQDPAGTAGGGEGQEVGGALALGGLWIILYTSFILSLLLSHGHDVMIT